jgi:predicted phage tail protein
MGTSQGFGTISVNGNQFTFCIYKVGITAPVWCQTFTKGAPPATSTPTVTNPPSVPLLVSPLTNALTTNYKPRLDWRDSTVPAGTTFQKYELQLAPDSGFASPTSVDIAGPVTISEYTPITDLNPNMKFYWRVRAYNTMGKFSNWSLVRSFRTALLPPAQTTPLDAENLLYNRPTFTWGAVDGATSYVIQISRNDLFKQLVLTTSLAPATFTPKTDLPANMTLYWRVQSRGVNGPSAWSAVQTVNTANPPGIPVLLLPSSNELTTDYTPRLDWGQVTLPVGKTFDYFDHYQVQVADNAAFTTPVVDESGLIDFVVHEYTPGADLTPNTKYYWRVRSYNTLGQYSSWSLVRIFRTALLPPALSTPTDGFNLLNNRPTFDWNDVSGAVGYTLQVSKNSLFTQLAGTYPVTSSTCTPTTDLPANMILYWRVQSRGANGPSAWSVVQTVNAANPPGIPSLLNPGNNALTTDYRPLLDWAIVTVPIGTTFDHYQIQVADNAAFTSPVIDDSSILSITAHQFTSGTNLNANVKFYWRVRSYNTIGQYSSWSLVRSFRTAISPPRLVAPANNAQTNNRRPIFDWRDVTGASSYTIQVSTNSSFTTLKVNATVVSSTYTPTIDLPIGTLYWRVKANGVNGPSLWSVTRNLIEQ